MEEKIQLPENLTFNETTIPIPQDYEALYVPVKPICQIIDTDFKKQDSWLKKDDYFGQLYTLRYTVGADGKRRKMNCLPIIDVLTWIASIDNANKTEQQIARKIEFMKWLRHQTMKLFKGVNQILKENEHEVYLMNQVERDEQIHQKVMNDAKFYRDRINHNLKSLEELRTKRFSAQYELEFKPRFSKDEKDIEPERNYNEVEDL